MLSVAAALCACAATRHFVMTADAGYYSGLSEGHLVYEAMQHRVNVSSQVAQCEEVIEGTLGGATVSLITTGIGHDNAASCMVDALHRYESRGEEVADVIYMGTSGWSPVVGGLFNMADDPTCSSKRPGVGSTLVAMGDVCISPLTFLENCGFCKWAQHTIGECSEPVCEQHDNSFVFGQCSFAGTDRSLADSLVATARSLKFEPRSRLLSGYIETYWNALWGGLGYPQTRPEPLPNVYDSSVCGEAASYNLWSGIAQDYQCRLYLSQLITRATGKATTPDEVLCVSAMEGPGWASVLLKKAAKGGRTIPFANIRAASNYDSFPMVRSAQGALFRNDSWLPASKVENFTKEGYQYAIGVASKVVLTHYGAL